MNSSADGCRMRTVGLTTHLDVIGQVGMCANNGKPCGPDIPDRLVCARTMRSRAGRTFQVGWYVREQWEAVRAGHSRPVGMYANNGKPCGPDIPDRLVCARTMRSRAGRTFQTGASVGMCANKTVFQLMVPSAYVLDRGSQRVFYLCRF